MSPKTLLEEHTSTQERKLYEAIVALQEGADLAEYMAERVDGPEQQDLRKEAEQLRRDVETLQRVVEGRRVSPVD
jgi:hypothetical protein